MQRRSFLSALAGASLSSAQLTATAATRKGRLKQSCMSRSFVSNGSKMGLDEMCRQAVRLGAVGMDIFPVEQWPTIKSFGLVPTMGRGGGIEFEPGIIRKEMHKEIAEALEKFIDYCAANGCPNV